jgi:hypothetical protein
MARPQEICIEDLTPSDEEERYIRCVALVGGVPGLALDRHGRVRWMPSGPADYALCVSADNRLVLLRGHDVDPITVERGGRRIEAPEGKPVILLDQDLLGLDGRRLRVHVHGEAQEIHAPTPVASMVGRLARAAAAALAIGAGVGAGVRGEAAPAPPIEVRARPPIAEEQPSRQVSCTITAMKAGKVLVVRATCPRSAGVRVGTNGEILDPKTQAPVPHGGVRVTSVTGNAVVGEAAKLTKPVKATTIRFTVY